MPSVSRKQQKFMRAELSRKRHGEKTVTGMSTTQLEDFATESDRQHSKGNPMRYTGAGPCYVNEHK